MERGPHSPEGGEHHNETNETSAEPIYEQLSDEQRIQRGIAEALHEGRVIDDATARRIAGLLHGGQDSALYALAASGALPDRLEREIGESAQDLPPELDSWNDALLDYAEARGEDRGPREGWAELTADDPETAIEVARAAASRERRADRARLERYVELGLDPGDAEAVIEFEHLSREQRAQWAGTSTEPPGDAPAREAAEPAEPHATPEYETTPRPSPRIYVADLAAYNHGRLHGVWLDATRDVDELWADIRAMLADSPVPGAEEFAIHDFEDFTGYPLGEHENLAFVSKLAKGIAEHGQAFAAYADWNRQEDPELERFSEHFEGTHPTREAWAEEVADEVFEWPHYRDAIPEPLRSHVTLNLASLALELEQYRHVVEGHEGVYVFNPDA
ncbi:MAG: antirestriction protein ArdA [Actinomycetota bacterium]|nr:antirestriction protein ArdA [Actinomycetota bacterium]